MTIGKAKANRPRSVHPAAIRFARDLLVDEGGNTIAMITAALVPLLAMIGGGVDMGRSYMSQSRLQQACDAGVLAARKKLGAQIVTDSTVPAAAEQVGNRFFDINFQAGTYGTTGRDFAMEVQPDMAISGVAIATVPTSVMKIFGYTAIPLKVECEAKLNYSDTDIMMVLDTTGSMADINPGDSETRIDALRNVVRSFYDQLQATKTPGTRFRYGFVPYSTNVNVGNLLKSSWLVDTNTYQGREAVDDANGKTWAQSDVSGTATPITEYISTTCPANTAIWTELSHTVQPNGDESGQTQVDGMIYNCFVADAGRVRVTGANYQAYVYDWSLTAGGKTWLYKPVTIDVRAFKSPNPDNPPRGGSIKVRMGGEAANTQDMLEGFTGCIEERGTYEIDDYDNIDLSRALDLDLDLVPDPARPETQWRPMLHEISFVRSMDWSGGGSFTPAEVRYQWDYLNSGWGGFAACPAAARKLAEISRTDLDAYLDSLFPEGSTYHDIGMIWGGRLLSSTGLFASENADQPGKPISRHLIFLTDGETAPLDLSYGSYGIEPLDQRRWAPTSPLTLTQTVEKRFGAACAEVKKKNITVWVIGFGTTLNPIMTDCAGAGHYFEAQDSTQLADVFSRIAASIGDLRIAR